MRVEPYGPYDTHSMVGWRLEVWIRAGTTAKSVGRVPGLYASKVSWAGEGRVVGRGNWRGLELKLVKVDATD